MVTEKQKRDWLNLPAKEERINWFKNTNVEDIDDILKLWEVKTEMSRIDIKEQMELLKEQVSKMQVNM